MDREAILVFTGAGLGISGGLVAIFTPCLILAFALVVFGLGFVLSCFYLKG